MQLHYTTLTHMIIKYLSHSYEHMRGSLELLKHRHGRAASKMVVSEIKYLYYYFINVQQKLDVGFINGAIYHQLAPYCFAGFLLLVLEKKAAGATSANFNHIQQVSIAHVPSAAC